MADAQNRAIGLQQQQYDQVTQNLAPYLAAGLPALQQIQQLSTLQGQQSALNDYYNSGQYHDLASQARYQQQAGAEASGGLGSSATANGMAAIAPTLGQNWLSGQMQNYGNLMNVGMNAATGQATAGQNYANNTGSLLQGLGAIQAGQAQQPSRFGRALGGAIAGAQVGSTFGPWGGVIGAGLGTVGSLF
ncbi:DNA transfer protein [Serratia marcescens]|uniref:DNA transfer protein n=2 Tax=Serratia marcescens TaxID=615 RepID=A0A9X8VCT7_SERMA|nr:DNA transfer protein [Serratia marcescens]MBS3894732.1 DNA transfer protein [Serratia marcescens]